MVLRAGKLSMTYENGFLRYIVAGEEEVLRMIYFAVRNTAWDTIPSEITDEKIIRHEDSFSVTYNRTFDHDELQMHWQVKIKGLASSEIHFEIKGHALSSFQKNRAGFCILHPIKGYTGKEVLIMHMDGATEKNAFPTYISPHQPFTDIGAMQWRTAVGDTGLLRFDGDVFETEDQRNWTDDSFKTYCTPLHLPFPATMHEGDLVEQTVHFSLSPALTPAIGIGRPQQQDKDHISNLQALSAIGFDHYRISLRLSEPDWQHTLSKSLEEAKILQAPLAIALLIEDLEQLAPFLDRRIDQASLKSITVLPASSPGLPSLPSLHSILPPLRSRFSDILLGSGTDSHFTELNRSDINTAGLDFISYAIHPQVHAFDDASLMENAAAQAYTVETARYKYGLPVHISPVTLHDRSVADARLYSDLGAAWTSASLKSLKTAGAASITYFDTNIAGHPVLKALSMPAVSPPVS